MRIVREQMLCIISSDWTAGEQPFDPDLHDRLAQLFTDVGVVHFASAALLPPPPGLAQGTHVSMMLEIAVDEGVPPRDLLAALAHHPGGALADLYGAYLQLAPGLPTGARNERVLEHLLAGLSVADGGFVGPRDRSLAQVREERALYDRLRRQVAVVPERAKAERTPYATALANWARAESGCDCATTPAPRSFWRAQGGMAKVLYFGAIVGAVALAVWLIAFGFSGLDRLLARAGSHAWSDWLVVPLRYALQTVAAVAAWAVHAGGRLVLVLLGAAVALGLYAAVSSPLRRRLPGWDRWFRAILYELDRPTDAWSSRITHAFMWLVVAAVAADAALALAYVLAGGRIAPAASEWLLGERPAWVDLLLFAYAALFSAMLLALAIGLSGSRGSMPLATDGAPTRALKAFRRWLHRPSEDDIPRAQQVHESLERCEAANVAGVSHLISLTELRRPYAWSAWWTRMSLRFVTAFGYIFFTEGSLANAPGIQFSHWHLIDGGRRLLFCANFDGTFGGYLDDFIKGPSIGTTLFWRWTHLLERAAAIPTHPAVTSDRAFAPTRLVVCRGVKCELKFKAYARESMLPNLFRFVAADLTLEQKNRATALRDALCGPRTDASDDLIMRALES